VSDQITVAVVGASGYTGAELCRLLLQHPHVKLTGLYARSSAGQPLSKVFPQFAGRLEQVIEPFDADRVEARAVFCALPHGESAPVVAALAARGHVVLDLSADLRLHDAATHETWYGGHAAVPPELRARAVYGLPELHRERLRGASLVAVPGCYPTAAILAATAFLEAELVLPDLIVDAKSGVSGAGRGAALAYHYPEVEGGIRAYKIAGTHRHTPEMEQELGARVTFTPHLVPMSRGILACVYMRPLDPTVPAARYHEALRARWQGEPFVTVLPAGALPDTAHVRGSNRAHVSVAVDERVGRVIALAAIDNLVKGAAGQAVQCLNLAVGLPETLGLDGVAPFP
jgi:N-acetyl-gamma-glutamyl-phosphate reductase